MDYPLQATPKYSPETMAQAILEMAGVTKPPTNADQIAQFLNLKITTFDDPAEYELDGSIRAFLIPSRRLIGVSAKLKEKRRKYSILHEVGHFVIPGHISHPELVSQKGIIEDVSKNFSVDSTVTLEIEANQFAAHCIFQLDLFDILVTSFDLNWDNVRNIANIYETSFEATARRWVERSTKTCALVVFKPIFPDHAGSNLEVNYTIVSRPFRTLYFDRLVKGSVMSSNSIVYKVFHDPEYGNEYEGILPVQLPYGVVTFKMQLFNNSYSVLGLLTPLD